MRVENTNMKENKKLSHYCLLFRHSENISQNIHIFKLD